MQTINIHDAKTNLSRLLERAVSRRESFIIAKAGKPLVKVVPLDQNERPTRRIGFMKGRIDAPDDLKLIGREAITAMFDGDE